MADVENAPVEGRKLAPVTNVKNKKNNSSNRT